MHRPPTVSIGIPAYNEATNIRQLLEALLKQTLDGAQLTEIIVISDGSTDRTCDLVQSVADERITLRALPERGGMEGAQNEIVAAARGDILVLLDADVLPSDERFLQEIIRPLQQDSRIGLVGADVVSAAPRRFFESIIAYSHALKQRIYRAIRDGDNVYLCHGRARAFSRTLYQQLRWPTIYTEDAFSYLFCRERGFRFMFAPAARVVFRSPSTFADHARQSNRFAAGRPLLTQHFDRRVVEEHFSLPSLVVLWALMWSFVRHPILTMSYVSVVVFVRFSTKFRPVTGAKYEIATSSKGVAI